MTPLSLLRRVGRLAKFGRYDHRQVFDHIFKERYWGNDESVSGPGSRLGQTENIRHELPALVRDFGIRTLFDAPCGDLFWVSKILPEMDVTYIGGDIVPGVIEIARARCVGPGQSARVFDIVSDPFPKADLWMCRDVLFHLSYKKIFAALANFCRSDIPYILVTTHTSSSFVNRNMVTGDFRQLDLFAAPFNFTCETVLRRFADYAPPSNPRDMVLLRRESVSAALRLD